MSVTPDEHSTRLVLQVLDMAELDIIYVCLSVERQDNIEIRILGMTLLHASV